jgi:hypothetical protein
MEGSTDLDHIVDSVGEMVNNIGLDTISAIIGELNKIIKDSPERKSKYHVHKRNAKRSLITRRILVLMSKIITNIYQASNTLSLRGKILHPI